MLRYARGNHRSGVGRLRGRRNERERTKNPRQPPPSSIFSPTPFRFSAFPLPRPIATFFPRTSPLPIPRQPTLLLSVSFSSLDISLSFRIPRTRLFIYTYIDLLYSTHISALMSVCGRRIVYIIRIPYVKCQSERIRAYKYACRQYWVWQPWRAIISDRDMLWSYRIGESRVYYVFGIERNGWIVWRSRCEEREIRHLFESLSCRKELLVFINFRLRRNTRSMRIKNRRVIFGMHKTRYFPRSNLAPRQA